mmetsp:Transcript_4731/g.13828  ORF Transcript_4731/g.13828 Transcript_4731/m.13828 type:complete len:259 (+) Transcript_4731:821-1597(+)
MQARMFSIAAPPPTSMVAGTGASPFGGPSIRSNSSLRDSATWWMGWWPSSISHTMASGCSFGPPSSPSLLEEVLLILRPLRLPIIFDMLEARRQEALPVITDVLDPEDLVDPIMNAAPWALTALSRSSCRVSCTSASSAINLKRSAVSMQQRTLLVSTMPGHHSGNWRVAQAVRVTWTQPSGSRPLSASGSGALARVLAPCWTSIRYSLHLARSFCFRILWLLQMHCRIAVSSTSASKNQSIVNAASSGSSAASSASK